MKKPALQQCIITVVNLSILRLTVPSSSQDAKLSFRPGVGAILKRVNQPDEQVY